MAVHFFLFPVGIAQKHLVNILSFLLPIFSNTDLTCHKLNRMVGEVLLYRYNS